LAGQVLVDLRLLLVDLQLPLLVQPEGCDRPLLQFCTLGALLDYQEEALDAVLNSRVGNQSVGRPRHVH